MSVLPENCPVVSGFNGYSACMDGMSPKRVLVPVRGNRPLHRIPVKTSSFPSSPHPPREGSSSGVSSPSSNSLRAWTSKGVWGKYYSPLRWPLTVSEGKTATEPINKHRGQSRSSALIVSLLMCELLCCFLTVTFTAHINPCVAHILAATWCVSPLRHHTHSYTILYID